MPNVRNINVVDNIILYLTRVCEIEGEKECFVGVYDEEAMAAKVAKDYMAKDTANKWTRARITRKVNPYYIDDTLWIPPEVTLLIIEPKPKVVQSSLPT